MKSYKNAQPQHVNYNSLYSQSMLNSQTRDYFQEFLEEESKQRHKTHEPDASLLQTICNLVPPKQQKPTNDEKMHPYIKIALEKETKTGKKAELIIQQRKRCRNYFQIAEEQHRLKKRRKKSQTQSKKKAQSKLIMQIIKQSTTFKFNQQPKRQRNQTKSKSKSHSKGDDQFQKRGPPYRPTILRQKDLFGNVENESKDKKSKSSKHPARHALRVMAKIKKQKELKIEKQKKEQEQLRVQVQTAQREIDMELQKRRKAKTAKDQEIIVKKPVQHEQIQTTPVKSVKREQASRIKLQQSSPKSKQCMDREQGRTLLQQEIIKQENVTQKTASKEAKIEDQYSKIKEQQRTLEQLRVELEERSKDLDIRQRMLIRQQQLAQQFAQLKEKQYQLNKKQKTINNHLHHRSKPQKFLNQSQSKSIESQTSQNSQIWRKQLRKITRYNPNDQKYRRRDQATIKESNYSKLVREEAISRRKGAQQQEEDRQYERKMKRWNH